MVSKYLREQKRYTQRELCDKLDCSEEKVVSIIRKLKEFGVLKAVRASDPQQDMSDLYDEDIPESPGVSIHVNLNININSVEEL